jgi:hypothetical protein
VRLVADLTGSGVSKLDPFARPETPLERVLTGWTSVFRWHRLEDLRRDLKAAEDDFGREMTDEKQNRFFALQDAVAAATADAIATEDT